ncbi:MAG: hypothetical protein K2N10_01615, partial [Muribaculaceae bacterium]|nr:hypothetical protein [Muribaculaceae bacterium]
LVIQLKSNALWQAGVRPKDMPDEFFQVPPAIDYRNPLEAALPLMQASRLIDMEDMAAAYESFSGLESRKNEIIGLYAKEIACELAFTALLTGHIEQARATLTEELMGYVNAYRRTMSSKQRLLCAKALYLDSDRSEAERIYRDLLSRQSQYLLKGEVASDIALMQSMLRNG